MIGAVHEARTLAGNQVSVIIVIVQVVAQLGVMAVVVYAFLPEDLFQFEEVVAADGLPSVVRRDDDLVIGTLRQQY